MSFYYGFSDGFPAFWRGDEAVVSDAFKMREFFNLAKRFWRAKIIGNSREEVADEAGCGGLVAKTEHSADGGDHVHFVPVDVREVVKSVSPASP